MFKWIFRVLIMRTILRRFWWAVPIAMIVSRLRGNDDETPQRQQRA